jgi:uncharacterized protein YndB with AHSA1/START domain
MSASAKPLESHKPSLTIKRRLNAPPAKVYAAWTDPAQLARWFGPADTINDSVKATLDVRVGGKFRASFTGCMDGNTEYHEVGGVYREVVPNEKLVFSWAGNAGVGSDRLRGLGQEIAHPCHHAREIVARPEHQLVRRGFREGRDLLYLAFPEAKHDESAWSMRAHLPFQWFFGERPGTRTGVTENAA